MHMALSTQHVDRQACLEVGAKLGAGGHYQCDAKFMDRMPVPKSGARWLSRHRRRELRDLSQCRSRAHVIRFQGGRGSEKNREMKDDPTMLLIIKGRFWEPTMLMKTSKLAGVGHDLYDA
jgi:hypothetical protein